MICNNPLFDSMPLQLLDILTHLSFFVYFQNQEEVNTTESEQVWKSLIEEGEDVLPLSSVDSSISNIEIFCYARLALLFLFQAKNTSFTSSRLFQTLSNNKK